MSKFVIFAHARSGSTSLAKVLAESRDVKMCIEPFHPKFSQWSSDHKDYHQLVTDEETMNEALDEIFEKYTAIKVLDYQLPNELYYLLLDRKELKILFLKRKNLFEAALSTAIGHQTNEWHKKDSVEMYKSLKPIEEKEISEWIEYVGELTQTYHDYVQKHRPGDFLELFYEELYSENIQHNIAVLQKICDFLDIALPPQAAIQMHMLPSRAKINYKNIYQQVPNYERLVKKFT
jgi:LPS sulfotransferase NodH